MNDQKFPGFQGDEPKPLKKGPAAPAKAPAKPLGAPSAAPAPAPSAPPAPVAYEFDEPAPAAAAPATAAAPAPAFNPFADQQVDVSPTTAAPPPAKPGTAAHAKPGTASHAKPKAAAPAADPAEADIRPGMAKDLWACPHCGTKNKPARETCRSCGKSPQDAVVVQWHQKPAILGAIAGGVVLLIVLAWFALRADVSFHPVGPGHLDSKVRLGGGGGGEQDLGDSHKFTGKGTLSVSGRILAAMPHPATPWVTMVSLALGTGAVKDEDFNDWKAEFKEEDFAVTGAPKTVTLFLIITDGSKPTFTRGGYLSVQGEYGHAEDELGQLVKFADPSDHPNTYVVKVKRLETE